MKKLSSLKEKLKKATAGDIIYFTCFVVSIVLLTVAFITPPPAEIHPTVLKAVGLMGIFSTISKIGDWIKIGMDVKLKKGDFEIQIENNENEKTDKTD